MPEDACKTFAPILCPSVASYYEVRDEPYAFSVQGVFSQDGHCSIGSLGPTQGEVVFTSLDQNIGTFAAAPDQNKIVFKHAGSIRIKASYQGFEVFQNLNVNNSNALPSLTTIEALRFSCDEKDFDMQAFDCPSVGLSGACAIREAAIVGGTQSLSVEGLYVTKQGGQTETCSIQLVPHSELDFSLSPPNLAEIVVTGASGDSNTFNRMLYFKSTGDTTPRPTQAEVTAQVQLKGNAHVKAQKSYTFYDNYIESLTFSGGHSSVTKDLVTERPPLGSMGDCSVDGDSINRPNQSETQFRVIAKRLNCLRDDLTGLTSFSSSHPEIAEFAASGLLKHKEPGEVSLKAVVNETELVIEGFNVTVPSVPPFQFMAQSALNSITGKIWSNAGPESQADEYSYSLFVKETCDESKAPPLSKGILGIHVDSTFSINLDKKTGGEVFLCLKARYGKQFVDGSNQPYLLRLPQLPSSTPNLPYLK